MKQSDLGPGTTRHRGGRSEPHGVHEGPSFILPPRDRLFCAFDRRHDAMEAVRDFLHLGAAHVDDVWVFVGERGAYRLDPSLVKSGPRVKIGRLLQRLFTGDAEFGDDLVAELQRGGIVLAIHIARDDVASLVPVLKRHGGHSIAFGAHWNYVVVGATLDDCSPATLWNRRLEDLNVPSHRGGSHWHNARGQPSAQRATSN